MNFDPTNTVLLAQKQELLSKTVAETAEQLDILRQAQEQVEKQFQDGEIGEEQYRAFQREVADTESYLQKLESQLEETTQSMGDVSSGTDDAGSALDELKSTIASQESELADLKKAYSEVVLEQGKSSSEALELASKITTLNSELNENKSRLNEVESEADQLTKAFDDVGDSADDTGSGFTVMKGALADLVSSAIQSAVSAIGDLVGSLFELSEATSEYRSMQAKLSGSAQQFGYDLEYVGEKYKQLYGYVADEQMSTNAITNLLGLGASTDTLDQLVDGAIATWTAYGDSIPIESLTESMTETINVGKVTGTLADAINWASRTNEEWNAVLGNGTGAQKAFNKALSEGKSVEDAFSEALSATTNEQDRAKLVADLLNTTYGESKSTYDETAGSMIEANEAQSELTQAQAELGEAVEPVNTAFSNFKARALDAITPLIQTLADKFLELTNYLRENPAVMQAVTAVVVGLATAFGVLATVIAIQGVINGVNKAFTALNITMHMNPIMLVVTAIAGLVAGFITLWNTSDSFRNFWIGLWENIKTVASGVWDAIKSAADSVITGLQTGWETFTSFFSGLWEGIKTIASSAWEFIQNVVSFGIQFIGMIITTGIQIITLPFQFIWENCKGIITGAWEAIKTVVSSALTVIQTVITTVLTAVSTFISTVWNGIKTVTTTIFNAIKTVVTNVWNNIKSVITTVVNAVKTVVTTVWNGIKTVTSSVFESVKSVVSSIWNGIKSTITSAVDGVKSTVSKVWNSIKDTTSSVFEGIKSTAKSVWDGIKSAIETPINAAKDAVKSAIDKMKSFFNFSWELPKLKLPHFDIKGKFSLSPPSVPKFSISWYKKAMNNAMILKKPTIFGYDQNSGKYLGGGEAGDEVVAGAHTLQKMISEAVAEQINKLKVMTIDGSRLKRQLDTNFTESTQPDNSVKTLVALVAEYFPKLIEASQHDIVLDSGTLVGETIDKIDHGLARNYDMRARGM